MLSNFNTTTFDDIDNITMSTKEHQFTEESIVSSLEDKRLQDQHYMKDSTNQDIDEQIATLNSLIISDQQQLDNLLDTRSNNATTTTVSSSSSSSNSISTMTFNNVFGDNLNLMSSSSGPNDRQLFRNNSFSVPQNTQTDNNNIFMNYHLNASLHPPNQQLLRRESFPNLSSSYLSNKDSFQYNNHIENYTNSQWQNYLQIKQQPQPQQQSPLEHNMFLMQPNEAPPPPPPQQPYRKFSVDVPPSFVTKRLDILENKSSSINRLTPSYSNPDLSAARRTGSLDAGRLAYYSNKKMIDFDDYIMEGQPSNPFNPSSFPSSYNNNSSSNMNPLLASHLLRQMSISNPPARKNSFGPTQQQQLRRASSATNVLNANDQNDKFAFMKLEDVIHDIYSLCKDQYGCRFFQRKLEEQNPEQSDIIFVQIYPHFIELMTDPFGNYLCQKLMEYCTEVQRTMMIEQVSTAIMSISVNMHGTRAVQKMIEVSVLPEQVEQIKNALSPNVVSLIRDINGNHVIQKCLNKLSHADKQFIYDAVSDHCNEVATHRHGCCVLQRCIDFSSKTQKTQLVNEIIRNALTLVQDPYGNYVVQYVLELGDAHFSDQLIRQFIGHIANLSVQKYSSNVMEKCIRVAEEDTRRDLIEEMVNRVQLEKLLKDSYANYVVQTALDFAEETQHQKLSECIRPLLPSIRNTSYCKRIQGKLNRDQKQQQQYYLHKQQQPYSFQTITASSNLGDLGGIGGVTTNGNIHPLMNANDVNFIPTSPFYFK